MTPTRRTNRRRPQVWTVRGNTARLEIRGHTIIIDTEDLTKAIKYTWNIFGHKNAKRSRVFYAAVGYGGAAADGKQFNVYLSRLVMNASAAGKSICVRHVNDNGLDCRKSNLLITGRGKWEVAAGIYNNNEESK